MKFWSKLISCAVVLFMVSVSCLPALAAQTNISIYLPEDQLWSTGFGNTTMQDISIWVLGAIPCSPQLGQTIFIEYNVAQTLWKESELPNDHM